MMLYLQPQIIKLERIYDDYDSIFEAFQKKYHHKKLSDLLYVSLKLMSFKMKDGGANIREHIEGFNDLVVDLFKIDEELNDEKNVLHLLNSLPPSYQLLSRVLFHHDRKTITYNKVVSVIFINDMQQKLVLFSHHLVLL